MREAFQLSGSTVEGETTCSDVLAHLVFRYALVATSVILLEAGYLQDRVEVLHLHLAGERDTVGSLPGNLRDRTGRQRERS